MIRVSGLPVDRALARLREAGIDCARVEMTRGRRECQEGEVRALRFQKGVLLAAAFPPALTAPGSPDSREGGAK